MRREKYNEIQKAHIHKMKKSNKYGFMAESVTDEKAREAFKRKPYQIRKDGEE